MLGLGLGTNKHNIANLGSPFTDDYSVLLDGVDEYINIDAVQTALASSTVGTISMWIKPVDATPAGSEVLFAYGDTDANSEIIYYITPTTGLFRCYAKIAGVFQWDVDTDAQAFSDNTWAHVALVQDGTSPVLYINGSAPAQTFLTTTDKTIWLNDIGGLDNARIGCRNINSGGNTLFFNGNINDVLFVNRALNASQISDIYNSGAPKDESNIANGVAYFKFDGDTVPTCTDSIGSNNGTYVNVEQADIELDTP